MVKRDDPLSSFFGFKLINHNILICPDHIYFYVMGAEYEGNSSRAFLASICEPYLEPFRKIIPPIAMLDISPIVAILVLRFATTGLWGLYRMIAF